MSSRPFIATFKSMPFGVKMITLWCLFGSVFFFAAFLPDWREEATGRIVTYSEWWLEGWGIACLAFGAGCMWSAIGLLRRRRLPTMFFMSFSFAIANWLGPERDIAVALIFMAALSLYLFRKKSAREFFESAGQ